MKSELAIMADEVFDRLKKEKKPIIRTDMEYFFCCGLVVKYILERLPNSDESKSAKRSDFVKTLDSKMMKQKIENIVKKDYINRVKHPHSKADHLVAEVLMWEPEVKRRCDNPDSFIYGVIYEYVWYSNTEYIDAWQKENGMISKSYKLNSTVVNEFADACKKANIAQSKKITEMMSEFIKTMKE